jgi:predicted nucleotide-binding protein
VEEEIEKKSLVISQTMYDLLEVPQLEEEKEEESPTVIPTKKSSTPKKRARKQIFIAHGQNKVPLKQLKTILDQYKIPFKVASEDLQVSRPISKKVVDLMKNCSSAIFIFTADEEYTDLENNKRYRPNDNIFYELGAATILYENKIVIFKEEGVSFPNDFRDFGYISFGKDNITAKSMELLKELIKLDFIKIIPA